MKYIVVAGLLVLFLGVTGCSSAGPRYYAGSPAMGGTVVRETVTYTTPAGVPAQAVAVAPVQAAVAGEAVSASGQPVAGQGVNGQVVAASSAVPQQAVSQVVVEHHYYPAPRYYPRPVYGPVIGMGFGRSYYRHDDWGWGPRRSYGHRYGHGRPRSGFSFSFGM